MENAPIIRLIELIEACNQSIERNRMAGEKEEGLSIRQDKYQRQKFIDELNLLLKEKHLVLNATI